MGTFCPFLPCLAKGNGVGTPAYPASLLVIIHKNQNVLPFFFTHTKFRAHQTGIFVVHREDLLRVISYEIIRIRAKLIKYYCSTWSKFFVSLKSVQNAFVHNQ